MKETIDIFKNLGVEVTFPKEQDFLKIKETLSRIGVASKKNNTLYQSCHILHKQGRYSIFHFKELFILDGKESDFSVEDNKRRNTIAGLLEEWGLVTILDPSRILEQSSMAGIKVLNYSEKSSWTLMTKYSLGKK